MAPSTRTGEAAPAGRPVAARDGAAPGAPASAGARRGERGFTLIEMMIVAAIMGILASVAMVQMRQTPQRAKEAALKENLYVLRNVIDQYFTDKGKYPDSLQTLVSDGYIRKIPVDPMTGSNSTWVEVQAEDAAPANASGGSGGGGAADDAAAAGGDVGGGIADVKSGSDGTALDGSRYSEW